MFCRGEEGSRKGEKKLIPSRGSFISGEKSRMRSSMIPLRGN